MRNSISIQSLGYHAYILLWCIYWLQGFLYASGGALSQGILGVLLLVSIYHLVLANVKYSPPPVLRTLSVILLLFAVYGTVSLMKGETFIITESCVSGITAFGYIKNILISFLPVYTIYIGTKTGKFTETSMRIWTLVFLVVSIICFFQGQQTALMLSKGDEVTNNSAYSVLAIIILLPLFNKKPVVQYAMLAICVFYVVVGMKRGAWICGAVAGLWFMLDRIRAAISNKRFFRIILFSAIVLSVAVYIINMMMDTSEYFNQRINSSLEGYSSNRDKIYLTLFNHFIRETSAVRFLFGNGANATLNISSNYAHNDWLEMAINNGLVMIILYIVFWVQLFKVAHKSRNNREIYMILSLYFIIYILKSFYSMSYADVPLWASVGFGYALAMYQTLNDGV